MSTPSASRPLPNPTPDSETFWHGANRGVLRIQRCKTCGRHRYPPGNRCPSCWSDQYEWIEAAGTGTVYSFTVMRRAYHPGLVDVLPYVVGVVELDEGVRLVTNIVGCLPEDVSVGMQVRVTFTELVPGTFIPTFTPSTHQNLERLRT
jgi:uncharacterized protein